MTEKHPVTASRGGENTAFVNCKVYNGRRHYCVCLRIAEDHDAGTPRDYEPDCNSAIAGLECPALAMREAEEKAGHALHYIPRNIEHLGKTTVFDKSYQRGWGAIDKAERNVPKKGTSKPKRSKARPATHADLVNKLLEEENAKQ